MSERNRLSETLANHHILLFDGVCNLCNGVVQSIIERDDQGKFRFAPLQSEIGTTLLARCGLPTDQMNTMVLVEDDAYYTKSDAALRIANHLGGYCQILDHLRLLPKSMRDPVYAFISRRRYDLFDKKERCLMPTPDIRERFLTGVSHPSIGSDGTESTTAE